MTFFHKNLVPQNPISFSTIDNSSLEICFWVSYRCTKSIGNNFDLKVIKWVKNDFFFYMYFKKSGFKTVNIFAVAKCSTRIWFRVSFWCVFRFQNLSSLGSVGNKVWRFFCGVFFLAKKVWFQNLSYNLSSSCTSYLGLIYELSCRCEIRF